MNLLQILAVIQKEKELKAMFKSFQESGEPKGEFEPDANSTILSKIWQLTNHCFLTFNNLAKLLQTDHALK
uniref:Uncharacterized protein n=1 Tax=Trichobilharzia regenti TaxID=157069 RepID=A0AA85K1W4_TRIRE|nr:unnamed protein product [Trichobilharzia regenti]